jgi:hypothetical protein
LEGSLINGAISLTGASWIANFRGNGPAIANSQSGGTGSTVTLDLGTLSAINWTFTGNISAPGNPLTLVGCRLPAAVTANANSAIVCLGCTAVSAITFTGNGGGSSILQIDSESLGSCYGVGLTATSIGVKSFNSQASNFNTVANNVTATNLLSTTPDGLMEAVGTIDLLAAGTTGTATLNVVYTDLNSAAQTLAITTGLLITAAVGTEVRGVVQFRPKAGTAVQFSITGVVTPGALSMAYAVSTRRVN